MTGVIKIQEASPEGENRLILCDPRGQNKEEQCIARRQAWDPSGEAALFTMAKKWKQSKCPLTDEWIKMCCIDTMEHYSAVKKNEMMPLAATWMQLETIILSEVSQKDKHQMISLICGI